jgi:DNA-binding winged helix-turn-helix (wHTH) protein
LLDEVEPGSRLVPDPARGGAQGVRYRFQDVVVDPARLVVTVGGAEVTCQPRVLQLLLLLCEAGGAVVGRDAVFGRLWPDQTFRSDESLTQVVHRLRATLGAAGAMVRTVRGVGFRLDGGVTRLADSGSSPAPVAGGPVLAEGVLPTPGGPVPPGGEARAAPDGEAVAPAAGFEMAETGRRAPADRALPSGGVATSRPARAGWLSAVAVLIVVAAGAAAVWLGLTRPWQEIDSGYALVRADLSPARRQTVDLVARALAAERGGDRAQARHLLEIAHATDASTPVPAIFRCLFSPWQEPGGEATAWARAATGRLRPGSSPYLHLLVRYADASASGRGTDWLAAASAILAIRPSAWYLRLARAHYHLARREEPAALADLLRIPIPALNGFSQALVLADRASLGDAAGAERDLAAGHLGGQEALAWYVRGRIAYSRRQGRAAVADLDREIDAALRHNQPDLVADARLLGGVAACESGDLAGAASRFDLAAAEAGEQHLLDSQAAALGLGAYLAWRRGDLAGRDRRLAEAAALHASPDLAFRLALSLLSIWLGARPPEPPAALAALLPDIPELTGARSLLLARQAQAAGDPERARGLLRQARSEGIARTFFLEEAALLGADLGEPAAPLRVDPPYPNLLRFAAAAELSRRSTLQ